MPGFYKSGNWNENNLNPLSRINWRASLVPAAAVIPAPIAYTIYTHDDKDKDKNHRWKKIENNYQSKHNNNKNIEDNQTGKNDNENGKNDSKNG